MAAVSFLIKGLPENRVTAIAKNRKYHVIMKIGDSVKVKQGTLDPDFNQYDMSGWQGRITAIAPNNKTNLIEIAWDSITLKQLPKEFIENSIEDGYAYDIMFLGKEDVELTKPRDKEKDAEKQLEKLEANYGNRTFDAEERRIATILPGNELSVTEENQKLYFDYLQKNLQKPILLTGAEDFPWEEKYLLGGWSKKEYEKLKKTQPSYTDTFEFIELSEEIDEMYGIIAKVKRSTDKKQFMLPLWDLKCVDRNSKNYELISDYSSWMTNYR